MDDSEGPSQKDQQISDVRREEGSRGKLAPASLAARKREATLRRQFTKLLERGTEAEFGEAMRALGMPADSPEFREALKIWRANRRS
jgi:hypothetical protein